MAAQTSTLCVTPSTSAQIVTLPATGGVSATLGLTFTAAQGAPCVPVTLETGADADGIPGVENVAPLLALVVNNTSTTYATFSSLQVHLPPSVNVPNATYYAMVSQEDLGSPQQTVPNNPPQTDLTITAVNGVLTVPQAVFQSYYSPSEASSPGGPTIETIALFRT
ncbi:MAG TPA: hypothetical protein VME66_03175 [Candidatus Acidoferrales bacterium]|nr:hypothetical protein [Candidatus Acidoferrales bacterium]